MQEEVNQKTVALSIRTTKLTGKVLAAALGKVVRTLQKHHRKALTPQGRQSVKKLMNHYGGKSAMPYVGAPKDFDRIAKEFHVDYAFHKVSPGHYLLFQVILRGQEGREPPKLQDTFIPGHGGDLAGGHQLPAKPLHILAVTFRLSTASALGLHRDGGLAQPVFRNIL